MSLCLDSRFRELSTRSCIRVTYSPEGTISRIRLQSWRESWTQSHLIFDVENMCSNQTQCCLLLAHDHLIHLQTCKQERVDGCEEPRPLTRWFNVGLSTCNVAFVKAAREAKASNARRRVQCKEQLLQLTVKPHDLPSPWALGCGGQHPLGVEFAQEMLRSKAGINEGVRPLASEKLLLSFSHWSSKNQP